MKKKHPSRAKAKEMLHDGSVRGHKLTEKQRRYFAMLAHGSPGQRLKKALG